MASYSNAKCAVSMRLNLGSGPDGKAITRSVTISRVKSSSIADKVKAVSDVLAPLLAYPVIETLKTDTDLVEE